MTSRPTPVPRDGSGQQAHPVAGPPPSDDVAVPRQRGAGRSSRSRTPETAPEYWAAPEEPPRGSAARGFRGLLLSGVLLLLTSGVAGVTLAREGRLFQPRAAVGGVDPPPSGAAVATPGGLPGNPADVPDKGTGAFIFADSQGAVLGAAGTLKRFRVAVEDGSGVDPTAFAAAVDATFADPRGWTAGGLWQFQRVPKSAPFDFTVFLATPATSEQVCLGGGLHTQKYTSCRLASQVVLNLARWLHAVPEYGAPVEVYRSFAVNHEVGKELGYRREGCVGPGRQAPVMQQQTLGLKGCLANAWLYLDGVLYSGPPIP